MFTELTIQVRRFAVTVSMPDSEELIRDHVVLTLDQLHAAQLIGQSSKELIQRLYLRQGLQVVEIGKADKHEIRMNLEELYRESFMHRMGKREKVQPYDS